MHTHTDTYADGDKTSFTVEHCNCQRDRKALSYRSGKPFLVSKQRKQLRCDAPRHKIMSV